MRDPFRKKGKPKQTAEDTRRYLLSIWHECRRISGTPAERYLRGRGIAIELPPSLRYHPALKHTDIGGLLPCMRAEARRRGLCRGIGTRRFHRAQHRPPRGRAEIIIDPAGVVEVILGTMSAGQGHETSFAQVIGEWLGVAPGQVRLVTGDTDRAGLDHHLSRILRYRGEADVVAGNDHHEPLGGTI
jgi:Molybdopterin-binding domain of aldehyde dehydrogenase